ncbi:MAG TPA: DinB family protein [Vicinamibacterales bacterium]|nr:DinB family protein [Vicinamibacterales bacterium]
MKRLISGMAAFAACTAIAVAQQPPAAGGGQMRGGGQMGGQKIGVATSLQRAYNGFKTNYTAAAEKMPDADYNFKPGSTPEARAFGAGIAHIANAQFNQCSALTGQANPMQGKNLEKELTTKAEITKALADSFVICDKAFEAVTDANAMDMVKQGNNEVTRVAALYGVIVHGNEMAGTAYVYLRSKNIVPPSTENMGRGMRGRG